MRMADWIKKFFPVDFRAEGGAGFLRTLGGHKNFWRAGVALTAIFCLANNHFFAVPPARAATLMAGSNFIVCTGQVTEYPLTGGAQVNWTFVSLAGNTQAAYRVLIDDDPVFGSANVDSGNVASSATFYAATGLVVGTRYYWRVLITDNNGSTTDWVTGDSFLLLMPSVNLKGGLKLRGDIKLR